MRNLPKPSIFQWTGMMLVLFFGTVALMEYPVGAQVESNPGASEKSQAKTQAGEPAAAETEKKGAALAPDSEKTPATNPATDNTDAPAPEAKALFKSAREKLAKRAYRAKIVQKLIFSDRTLQAEGSILRGQKFRMRLEFEIKTGGTSGKLVQVCNGDKLWTERRVNDVTRLTVQDVKEILSKAGPNRVPENLVIAEMGLGGVTALLASMERTMNFGKPRMVVMDGEELFRVDGVWNAEFMGKLNANPQLKGKLPSYIPDGARVYFDGDDFPRRIQYLKTEPKHEVMRPTVTLDFLDVEWLTDADVAPSKFEYQPPERVFPEDVTKSYVDQLKPPQAPAAPGP